MAWSRSAPFCLPLLLLTGCRFALDLPGALPVTQDAGSPLIDAGPVGNGDSCNQFRTDHPFAQAEGAQQVFVRAGAAGDGQSAESPAGEFSALPEGEGPVVVFFAAAQAQTWPLQLGAVTRPLTLIGSCEGAVTLQSQDAPLVQQQGGQLRLAWLHITGAAGGRALVEVSGSGALAAADLHLTSSDASHGISVHEGGDVALERLTFAAIGGHGVSSQQALGSWTVQDNSFLGPIGHDGISIIDFGGSGFRVSGENAFHEIAGTAMDIQGALGSWTVQDNTFLGPIGHDGISIIDFGGSGFRISGENTFHEIAGTAMDIQGALGSWTVQDNIFLGPIGLDGISIIDFGGSGFRIASNAFGAIDGSAMFASEAIGSWTVQDNTFAGPIGFDGIAVEGFHGDSMTISGNEISGVGRVGVRLRACSNTTVSRNSINSPGGRGIHAEGFSGADNQLNLANNTIDSALEAGISLDGMSSQVAANANHATNTRNPAQGGPEAQTPVGVGILAVASGRLSLTGNTLTGNATAAALVDLYDWGRDDPSLLGEGSITFAGNNRSDAELLKVWYRPPGIALVSDDPVDEATNRCPDAAPAEPCVDPRVVPEPIQRRAMGSSGCGDGIVADGENCDDFNRANGDGCDGDCQLEGPNDRLFLSGWALFYFGDWPTGADIAAGVGAIVAEDFDLALVGQGHSNSGQLGMVPADAPGQPENPVDVPRRTAAREPVALADSNSPFGPLALGDIVTLRSGSYSSQAWIIDSAQRAWGWGRNHMGQILDGLNPADAGFICKNDENETWYCVLEPTRLEGITEVRLASAGGEHSCFWGRLDDDDLRIACMGAAPSALGVARNEQTGLEAVDGLPPRANWRQLESGQSHNCALNDQGDVWCWGRNDQRQTNWVFEANLEPETGILVTGPSHPADNHRQQIVRIAVGQRHSCALNSSGRLSCWGDGGGDGRLGHSGPGINWADVRHEGEGWDLSSDRLIDVACGQHHTCVLRDDGHVLCFGSPTGNVLGEDPQVDEAETPINFGLPLAGDRATSIIASTLNSCAKTNSGQWYCWGDNQGEMLNPWSDALSPYPVPPPPQVSR